MIRIALFALCLPLSAQQGKDKPKPPADIPAAKIEASVHAGLSWLARHQAEDGSWMVEKHTERCGKSKCPPAGGDLAPESLTGFALLAFTGAGLTHESKDDLGGVVAGEVVAKAARFLAKGQKESGLLAGAQNPKVMMDHGMAATGLARLWTATKWAEIEQPVARAVDFIVKGQNPGKAWRYTPRSGDNDTWITGWALLALRSAEAGGVEVKKDVYEGAIDWLESVTEPNGRVGYTAKGTGKVFVPGKNEQYNDHPTFGAQSIAARMLLGAKKSDAPVKTGMDLLVKDPPAWSDANLDADFYYWYWATLALRLGDGTDGAEWKKWKKQLPIVLVPRQNASESCAAGSWDPYDRWGFEGGRVYATAMGVSALNIVLERPGSVLEPRKPPVVPKKK